jgi:hypothetical protein
MLSGVAKRCWPLRSPGSGLGGALSSVSLSCGRPSLRKP